VDRNSISLVKGYISQTGTCLTASSICLDNVALVSVLEVTIVLASSAWSRDRCRKLPRALKEWQAYKDLRKTIDDFNATCPLLEMMASKSMQPRHWDRISTVTGHVFDVDADNFFLRNLMMAPLLQNSEDIEVN